MYGPNGYDYFLLLHVARQITCGSLIISSEVGEIYFCALY
jgi:hypothetical protein